MAKAVPGIRLLRSLARAAKSQRTLATRMLTDALPKPAKPKAARKTAPASVRPANASPPEALTIRQHTRPAVSTAPGKWLTGKYPLPAQSGPVAGQRMSYWLYLPQHVPDKVAQHGWPLIVMLHGCHQSATQFAQGTRMNQLAEEHGYAVLYPQQPISVQPQRCWRWYDKPVQHGEAETSAIAGLIARIREQHAIDGHRIYACGLSAGAGMAAALALNHPELIAAVGLHSGPVFGSGHSPIGALHVMRHGAPGHGDAAIRSLLQQRGASRPMPAMPAILIQGEDDHVVRPVNQQQLARQWLHLNGLPPNSEARVASKPAGRGGSRNAHEIHDYLVGRKVLLRVARIQGLGHAWSGGDPALKFNSQPGPDASRMMLAFFSKHHRGRVP